MTDRQAARIVALGPDVVIDRGGDLIPLGALSGKLLVLLLTQRRPVTTDWLLDSLWRDDSIPRHRLSVLLNKLRGKLDLATDELIVRNPFGLSMQPAPGWSVDVWDFLDLSRGDTSDRLRALHVYAGDLCSRQFAYDDDIGEARRRLRRRWAHVTAGLLHDQVIDADTVLELAERAGVDLDTEPEVEARLGPADTSRRTPTAGRDAAQIPAAPARGPALAPATHISDPAERAALLEAARADDWQTAVGLLLDAQGTPGGDDLAREVALVIMRTGRVEGLRAALSKAWQASQLGNRSFGLGLRVLYKDAQVRMATAQYSDLEALRHDTANNATPDLELWLSAVIAEHAWWSGDFSALAMVFNDPPRAASAAGPIADAARARLLRLRGFALYMMVDVPESFTQAEALSAESIAILDRLGCADELSISRSHRAFGRFLASADRDPALLETFVTDVEQLSAAGSDRTGLGWTTLATGALASGDFALARRCVEELDRSDVLLWPILQASANFAALVTSLVVDGPSGALTARLTATVRRWRSFLVQSWVTMTLVGFLVDSGEVDLAADIIAYREATQPYYLFDDALQIRELQARLALLQAGGSERIAALQAVIDEWESAGRSRRATIAGLRGALDTRRVGLVDASAALEAAALRRLPPAADRGPLERHYITTLE